MEISELIKDKEIIKTKSRERDNIVSDIYDLYKSNKEGVLRKKDNWKRYISYLKENRLINSADEQVKFKKSRKFIKELEIGRMCFFLSHIKTPDLYFVLSECRDKQNRGYSIGAYIQGLLK